MAKQRAIRLAADLPVALVLTAAGSASSIPFDRGVLAYDRATAAVISKELLLNSARARLNQPMHSTAISNITATYRLTFSRGVAPAFTGDKGFLAVPFVVVGHEESPTLTARTRRAWSPSMKCSTSLPARIPPSTR